MYRETTENVEVEVECSYLPERSNPERRYFFFAYQITIKNLGESPVRLLRRHWMITNGMGGVEEVKGDGVVGEQPLIEPGQSYAYSSFCPLQTPTGNMRGTYEMVDAQGRSFRVKVPLFFLRDLSILH